jgi:hypothetical protein
MRSDFPVVLIIYNRHEILKKILAVLDNVKIKKLYVIADGPKNNKNDIEKVNKTRKLIEQNYKNLKIKIYSKKNLGLKKRIITGLDLVFAKEKAAIILEDDCIPSKDFFTFFNAMLKKFENDKTIATIGGSNHLSEFGKNSSYIKSKYFNSWGWATWRDRWLNKNLDPKYLLNSKKNYNLHKYLGSIRAKMYWRFRIWLIQKERVDSWAYLWSFYNFINKKKHILPNRNLINNIGIGKNSTNTLRLPYKYFLKNNKKKYKLNFSFNLLESSRYDSLVEDTVFSKNLVNRLKWIFK